MAEHFKRECVRIDDITFYGVVVYRTSTDLEEVNDRIRDNREFSTDSVVYEIYVRLGSIRWKKDLEPFEHVF